MKKTIGIPAAKWRKAKTEEQRAALREKYTVDMTAEEVAAHKAFQKEAAAQQEQAAKDAEKAAKLATLEDIDRRAARSLRAALISGGRDVEAVKRLNDLEAEAEAIRVGLAGS